MKKVFILILFFVFSPVFVLMAEDKIAAPYSPNEGDRWEFASNMKESAAVARGSYASDVFQGEFAAVYQRGKLIFLQMVGGKEYEAGVNSAGQLEDLFSFTNSKTGFFKFPISMGAEWRVEFEFVPRGRTQKSRYAGTSKVLGFKEVEVDAGRFQVAEMKIDGKQFTPTGLSLPMTFDILYSPETGCAVRFYRDNNVGGLGAKTEVVLTKFIPAARK